MCQAVDCCQLSIVLVKEVAANERIILMLLCSKEVESITWVITWLLPEQGNKVLPMECLLLLILYNSQSAFQSIKTKNVNHSMLTVLHLCCNVPSCAHSLVMLEQHLYIVFCFLVCIPFVTGGNMYQTTHREFTVQPYVWYTFSWMRYSNILLAVKEVYSAIFWEENISVWKIQYGEYVWRVEK